MMIGICVNCRVILDEYAILYLCIVEKYGIPMSLFWNALLKNC